MPVDCKGAVLKKGDIVAIPCIITGIDEHSGYLNVALKTLTRREPDGKQTEIFVNTRQVELLARMEPDTGSDYDMDQCRDIAESHMIPPKEGETHAKSR